MNTDKENKDTNKLAIREPERKTIKTHIGDGTGERSALCLVQSNHNNRVDRRDRDGMAIGHFCRSAGPLHW